MRWPSESHFDYREYRSTWRLEALLTACTLALDSPPLTHISVRRTLQGTDQSQGRLALVIENHYDTQLKASYLETMPWLLQFHLNSIQIKWNGEPRGM